MNQGFSYLVCLMMEGSWSGAEPLTNGFGCGSGMSKNIRLIWIRTAVNLKKIFFLVLLLLVVRISQAVSYFSYHNQKWDRLGNLTCRVLVGRVFTNTYWYSVRRGPVCTVWTACLVPAPRWGEGTGCAGWNPTWLSTAHAWQPARIQVSTFPSWTI